MEIISDILQYVRRSSYNAFVPIFLCLVCPMCKFRMGYNVYFVDIYNI